MLNVAWVRAEFIQTAGYELAGNVIQCSSRLAPLLFFSLQSTDRRFCGLCRGHSRVTTQIRLAANCRPVDLKETREQTRERKAQSRLRYTLLAAIHAPRLCCKSLCIIECLGS